MKIPTHIKVFTAADSDGCKAHEDCAAYPDTIGKSCPGEEWLMPIEDFAKLFAPTETHRGRLSHPGADHRVFYHLRVRYPSDIEEQMR